MLIHSRSLNMNIHSQGVRESVSYQIRRFLLTCTFVCVVILCYCFFILCCLFVVLYCLMFVICSLLSLLCLLCSFLRSLVRLFVCLLACLFGAVVVAVYCCCCCWWWCCCCRCRCRCCCCCCLDLSKLILNDYPVYGLAVYA